MKLTLQKRTNATKGETNRLRREGHIPAVLYDSKGEASTVSLQKDELQAILRTLKPGLLSTTVFHLNVDGKQFKGIIKDVQYHVATYDIQHIDFLQLSDHQPVTVNVPIQLVGVADCAGVKLGGFLRQVIRELKVECLPKDIPQTFTVDVRDLGLAQSKRLSDIAMPANVKACAMMSEVAVLVGKKAGT